VALRKITSFILSKTLFLMALLLQYRGKLSTRSFMKKVERGILLLSVIMWGHNVMAEESTKKFEVYGFVQTDYIQDFKRVNPDWDTTLRPSKIPTTTGQYGSDGQAVISVKQSRFGVKGNLPTEGKDLYTQFEFDMYGVGDDEGQTTLRLRHAYGEYGNWLAGQTMSLFMDIDAFPNSIDYWGPSGMVFLRNPQIRYSLLKGENVFAIAIEKPSNDIDPGKLRTIGDELGVTAQGDEKFPDFTAMARINRSWGHFQVSSILRGIGFETTGGATNEPKNRLTGWGLNFSSNIKFLEKDKLILAAVYGNGIASYMNDGGTDLGAEGTLLRPRAKLIPLLGLTIFYDHYWSDQYSSSIGYSRTQVDNSQLQTADAFQKGEYALTNLLYTPVKNVLVGGELLWGSRTDNDGDYGTDVRTQISFKYSFSSLSFL
jgi:hypothetical protein